MAAVNWEFSAPGYYDFSGPDWQPEDNFFSPNMQENQEGFDYELRDDHAQVSMGVGDKRNLDHDAEAVDDDELYAVAAAPMTDASCVEPQRADDDAEVSVYIPGPDAVLAPVCVPEVEAIPAADRTAISSPVAVRVASPAPLASPSTRSPRMAVTAMLSAAKPLRPFASNNGLGASTSSATGALFSSSSGRARASVGAGLTEQLNGLGTPRTPHLPHHSPALSPQFYTPLNRGTPSAVVEGEESERVGGDEDEAVVVEAGCRSGSAFRAVTPGGASIGARSRASSVHVQSVSAGEREGERSHSPPMQSHSSPFSPGLPATPAFLAGIRLPAGAACVAPGACVAPAAYPPLDSRVPPTLSSVSPATGTGLGVREEEVVVLPAPHMEEVQAPHGLATEEKDAAWPGPGFPTVALATAPVPAPAPPPNRAILNKFAAMGAARIRPALHGPKGGVPSVPHSKPQATATVPLHAARAGALGAPVVKPPTLPVSLAAAPKVALIPAKSPAKTAGVSSAAPPVAPSARSDAIEKFRLKVRAEKEAEAAAQEAAAASRARSEALARVRADAEARKAAVLKAASAALEADAAYQRKEAAASAERESRRKAEEVQVMAKRAEARSKRRAEERGAPSAVLGAAVQETSAAVTVSLKSTQPVLFQLHTQKRAEERRVSAGSIDPTCIGAPAPPSIPQQQRALVSPQRIERIRSRVDAKGPRAGQPRSFSALVLDRNRVRISEDVQAKIDVSVAATSATAGPSAMPVSNPEAPPPAIPHSRAGMEATSRRMRSRRVSWQGHDEKEIAIAAAIAKAAVTADTGSAAVTAHALNSVTLARGFVFATDLRIEARHAKAETLSSAPPPTLHPALPAGHVLGVVPSEVYAAAREGKEEREKCTDEPLPKVAATGAGVATHVPVDLAAMRERQKKRLMALGAVAPARAGNARGGASVKGAAVHPTALAPKAAIADVENM